MGVLELHLHQIILYLLVLLPLGVSLLEKDLYLLSELLFLDL